MQGVEIEEDSSSVSIYSSFAADFLLTQESWRINVTIILDLAESRKLLIIKETPRKDEGILELHFVCTWATTLFLYTVI